MKAAVNSRPKSDREHQSQTAVSSCASKSTTNPLRTEKRPDCCTERFFYYLCLDDSPACGLFALLHVKTTKFQMSRQRCKDAPRVVGPRPGDGELPAFLSKLRVTGVGSLYLYSTWALVGLHVSMGILGPAPFFFESAGPAYGPAAGCCVTAF